MTIKFLDKKTHRFYFTNSDGERKSYVLIYGDEIKSLNGNAPSGDDFRLVEYRGRHGEWKEPPLSLVRSLELYFLDVGQGDAAFIVTPNDTKILVDGGLRSRALGFLIWKYRLDLDGNSVVIDHLFLSHADKDHVEGLIPLLNHPKITVKAIHHNGIGLFDSGFKTTLGDLSRDGQLITTHDTLSDLDGLDLASGPQQVFADWIDSVKRAAGAKGTVYGRLQRNLDQTITTFDIGDPSVTVEIVSPIFETDGTSLIWFDDKSHTINGHSLTFRLNYDKVRTFFSGDLNVDGSEHILTSQNGALAVNAHIFKAPHHGSHEFSSTLFKAINPMITVVSSGEVPDHGHPRANFLGSIGKASRGNQPLLFSTEIAALFVDAGDPEALNNGADTKTELDDLDFSSSDANVEARKRFKKVLPGIINIRTNGEQIYAFRRVQQGYQWVSYGPIQAML